MNISIVVLCALMGEARPIINSLRMVEVPKHFDNRLSFKLFQSAKFPEIGLVVFGKCEYSGAHKIGTQAASLACWETIKTIKPKLVASVGTAGGFNSKGAKIGDVFLSHKHIFFHGRHIPVPGYETFEIGKFPVIEINDPAIKLGVISSSDSLPASEIDLIRMQLLGTDAKDMEAAAIAEVACMTNTPVFALKSITDFIDSSETTHEQFMRNFSMATENLTQALNSLLPQLMLKE